MALKLFAIIFLFALFLSSLHDVGARDSLMFNKVPSEFNQEIVVEVNKQPVQNLPNKEATNPTFNPNQQTQQQQDQQQNTISENIENTYGLYGHESGPSIDEPIQFSHLPPSIQNQNNKYLSENYNNVAYVTQPKDFNGYTNTKTNNNNYQPQDNDSNYYNAKKKEKNSEFDFMGTEATSVNDNNKNSYYNYDFGNNNFNTRFMDASEATNNNYYNDGKSCVNRGEPQGMSDTRLMENAKYNYGMNVDSSVQYNNYNEDNMP